MTKKPPAEKETTPNAANTPGKTVARPGEGGKPPDSDGEGNALDENKKAVRFGNSLQNVRKTAVHERREYLGKSRSPGKTGIGAEVLACAVTVTISCGALVVTAWFKWSAGVGKSLDEIAKAWFKRPMGASNWLDSHQPGNIIGVPFVEAIGILVVYLLIHVIFTTIVEKVSKPLFNWLSKTFDPNKTWAWEKGEEANMRLFIASLWPLTLLFLLFFGLVVLPV
jgi:hypothetical protein